MCEMRKSSYQRVRTARSPTMQATEHPMTAAMPHLKYASLEE